jgi:UDP-3-O-[3-hydroxymyristoyl] glucosamine N-acyltransferase
VSVSLTPTPLRELAARYGGVVYGDNSVVVHSLAPVELAGSFELAPLLAARYVKQGAIALSRGACLLLDAKLTHTRLGTVPPATGVWSHPAAAFVLCKLLEASDIRETPAKVGAGSAVDSTAQIAPRVVIGQNVRIGPYSVIGYDGFGFVTSSDGQMLPLPHGGGVIVEDDVFIGAHVTIDAGTLAPTILRRGVKVDSHVHIGHNCVIGAGSMIAAQAGLAGSVVLGRNVLVGGQAGIADHIHIGDGARIAAKSGVIGDIAARATVAGYPAVARVRWLRGIARLYREGGIATAAESLRLDMDDDLGNDEG